MISLPVAANRCVHRWSLTPGEIAETITGKDYLSYSQITLFQACPLKWHFTYVQRVKPETISAALLMGASLHCVIQRHLECQLAGEQQPTVEELMDVFRQNWNQQAGDIPIQYSRDENAETQAETAKRIIETFLVSPYSRGAGGTLGIEETLRVSLHPDLPDLVAKVDHIAVADGYLVVTDFKTVRSMWSSETAQEHAEQLHLYAQAVQTIAQDFKIPVKLRFVIMTKAKTPKVESHEITADPGRVQRSTAIIRNVFQAMQSGVIYPSPSTMNCAGCPFQKRCAVWHRENQP